MKTSLFAIAIICFLNLKSQINVDSVQQAQYQVRITILNNLSSKAKATLQGFHIGGTVTATQQAVINSMFLYTIGAFNPATLNVDSAYYNYIHP
jgi:hypothetical protein